MEATPSSETSVLTRPKRRHIQEDGILHSHRRENPKSSLKFITFLPKASHWILSSAI
jgi:hypothetical protein